MKKFVLIVFLFVSGVSFGQQAHTYIFKLQGVDNPELAKQAITDMREILHIKVFYFDDDTDQFSTSTDWVYNWQDMAVDLNLHNYFLEGDVIHKYSE